MNTDAPDRDLDLLEGAAAIGAAFRWKPRRVHHMIDSEGMPVFKLGGRICARRSTLNAWLAEREAAARQAAEKSRQEAQEAREAETGSPVAPNRPTPATGQISRPGRGRRR